MTLLDLWRRLPRPVKRRVQRGWFEAIGRFDDGASLLFLNHGFASPDPAEKPLELAPQDEPNRCGIQLYHEVARAVDLRGLEVLEVSCGRGGGAAWVARHHAPRRMVGVDLTASAIRFCQRIHRVPGLSFERADATALPFADASFDAVLNVEASCTYPDVPAFLREATRVLRPGGHLLFADYRKGAKIARLLAEIEAGGLEIALRADLGAGVALALARDSERKRELIERRVPRPFRRSFQQFASVGGTADDERARFARGDKRYVRVVARKPEIGAPARRES